jgi:hypothetical protein
VIPAVEWLLRSLITWGLANPDLWAALVAGQATLITQQGQLYISETSHGGKRTTFAFPQSSSGQSLPMIMVQALIQKANWVLTNYTPDRINAYLATYPQDYTVATYW